MVPFLYLYLAQSKSASQYHLSPTCGALRRFPPRRVRVRSSNHPNICQRCLDRRILALGRKSINTLWRLYANLDRRIRAIEDAHGVWDTEARAHA